MERKIVDTEVKALQPPQVILVDGAKHRLTATLLVPRYRGMGDKYVYDRMKSIVPGDRHMFAFSPIWAPPDTDCEEVEVVMTVLHFSSQEVYLLKESHDSDLMIVVIRDNANVTDLASSNEIPCDIVDYSHHAFMLLTREQLEDVNGRVLVNFQKSRNIAERMCDSSHTSLYN